MRGITLVEVVAGTALLGTVLVTILIACSQMTAQARRADLRIEACRIANELLETWWRKREEFPRDEAGNVEGREGWAWRTVTVKNRLTKEFRAEVVVLEVFATETPGEVPATVEILLPEKNYEENRDRPDTD